MAKQIRTEPQQLQFSGTETLFPTNTPELQRKDAIATNLGFLTIGVVFEQESEQNKKALDDLLKDEHIEGVFFT